MTSLNKGSFLIGYCNRGIGYLISGACSMVPGGLPSIGSHRVGHDCSDSAAAVWYSNTVLWTLVTQSIFFF